MSDFETLWTSRICTNVWSVLALAAPTGVVIAIMLSMRRPPRGKTDARRPVELCITPRELVTNPKKFYDQALANHGTVVGVRRLGRMEYIVSESHIGTVLTNDSKFSFEKALTRVLHLGPIMFITRGTFLPDVESTVHQGLIQRLDGAVSQAAPCIRDHVRTMVERTQGQLSSGQVTVEFHTAITAAMATMLFGEEAAAQPQLIEACEELSRRMADATGLHAWSSVWRVRLHHLFALVSWLRLIAFVLRGFTLHILPVLWSAWRTAATTDHSSNKPRSQEPAFLHLFRKPGVRGSWLWFLRACVAALGIVFASAHQTSAMAVWVIFELANRPAYIDLISEEISDLSNESENIALDGTFTLQGLRNAVRLDSFIREVMRTKNDTLSTVRETTEDTQLDGVMLPKGSFVIPYTVSSHNNSEFQGFDAEEFDGMRWVDSRQSADSANAKYLVFGMGRWACPGRQVAIAEIKTLIIELLRIASPRIVEGTYNPHGVAMTMSHPPPGQLLLCHKTQTVQ